MYLHSDELEKFEIGECIRKKFGGIAFDGINESINYATKFYHIRYSDGDSEDMTVSDVRKYWIPTEENKKKRSSKKTTNNEVIIKLLPVTIHWKTKIMK